MRVLLNKPYGTLCQFTGCDDRPTLAALLPPAVPAPTGAPPAHDPAWHLMYAAGRLDHDSEGLLLLTDEGALIQRLTDPRHHAPKTYLVQIEREPDAAALQALRRGVQLNDGPTRPAEVERVPVPDWLWPRAPPVRWRKTVPDAWLQITLREGRNRQIRRMTAAVGHPTLRLIRIAIGPWRLGGLTPGALRVAD
ncbi:MAG: pseudouridine synthase [Metallibacterium sp.]